MQNTQNVTESTKSIFITLCPRQRVNLHCLISNTHKENNNTSHISKVMKQINGRFQTQGHVFRPNCKTVTWPCSRPGFLAVPLVDRLVSQNIDFSLNKLYIRWHEYFNCFMYIKKVSDTNIYIQIHS